MKDNNSVAVIIPSRIGSTRLEQKAILPIGRFTMIERVARQAMKSGYNNVYIATDSELIARRARALGIRYVMTRPDLPSGTDRVYAALEQIDDDEIEYVVNLQGDMPFISPDLIEGVIDYATSGKYGITTAAVKVTKEVAEESSNVKVVIDKNNKALYFSRSLVPFGVSEYNYHVGIYVFSKNTLHKFVSIPVSDLEKAETLEQLRALDNGMDIHVWNFDGTAPLSIDTEEDYLAALEFLKNHLKDQD